MISVPLAFSWRYVLFANWPVDSNILDNHLPEPLNIHEYDSTGWVSIVPFVNVNTRPYRLPAGMGIDLPELNLRTYVVRDGEPGVYFFSLDTPNILAVLGARLTHRLPYYRAQMFIDSTANGIRFRSQRRHPGSRSAIYEATYQPVGKPFTAEPDSLARFLTERRRLYTQSQNGCIRYTDIDHERWTLYEASVETNENILFRANGFPHPATSPVCYYSPGVDVVTTRNKRWAQEKKA